MGKKLDLIGQRFGRLVVEDDIGIVNHKRMWSCRCDCGKYIHTNSYLLRSGQTQSCGCLRAERVSKATVKDLIGQRFEKLVVIKRNGSKNRNVCWDCRCDCGNICNVRSSKLLNGRTKSCGHCISMTNEFSLVGQQFDKLTVIAFAGKKASHTLWQCKCECGNEKVILGTSLLNGRTKSCGCLRSDMLSKGRFKDLTGQRFGRLVALSFSHMNERGSAMWQCLCDCGKICIVNSYLLVAHKTKSCGCLKSMSTHSRCFKDLSGQKINKLIVLNYFIKNGRTYYRCKCDCGNDCIVERTRLIKGQYSCGCSDVAHLGSKGELEIKAFMDNLLAEVSYNQKGK